MRQNYHRIGFPDSICSICSGKTLKTRKISSYNLSSWKVMLSSNLWYAILREESRSGQWTSVSNNTRDFWGTAYRCTLVPEWRLTLSMLHALPQHPCDTYIFESESRRLVLNLNLSWTPLLGPWVPVGRSAFTNKWKSIQNNVSISHLFANLDWHLSLEYSTCILGVFIVAQI